MWMLRWTGEQILPTIKDAATVYQHVHRYVYASEFVRGKRVLDLMAGEGDGSSILAQTAASVVGVIADEATAGYAREKHTKSSITFIVGSINPQVPDSFDAIVWFGASEAKFDATSIPAIKERLLKPDGLFILSSENEHELRQQLTAHFKRVQVFGQRIYANSSIWPMEPGSDTAVREVVMARDANGDFRTVASGQRSALSFIAVASDLPSAVQANGSVFIDEGNELLVDKESTIRELTENKAYQAAALKFSQSQLAERRESLAHLQEAFAWHKSQIDSLTKARDYLETEAAHFKSAIASNEEALAWRASQVRELEKAIEGFEESLAGHVSRIESLEREIEPLRKLTEALGGQDLAHLVELAKELEAIKASAGWKIVLQVRAIRDRLAFWR